MSTEFDRSIIGSEFDRTVHPPTTQADIDAYVASCGDPAPAPQVAPATFVVSLRAKHFLPPKLPPSVRAGFDAAADRARGLHVTAAGVTLVTPQMLGQPARSG